MSKLLNHPRCHRRILWPPNAMMGISDGLVTNMTPSLKSGPTKRCLRPRWTFCLDIQMPVRAHGLYNICAQTIISPTDFEQDQRRPSQSRLLAHAGRRDEPHLSLTHTLYRRLSPAGRTREPECGLFSRGGLGEEDTLADAIPPFLLLFRRCFPHRFLSPSALQNSLHHSFPFSDTTWVVGNGWLYYWMDFLCVLQLPSVCASSLRGTHFSAPTVFYYKAII